MGYGDDIVHVNVSTSGVGVQARFLITGLQATGKYTFRCFGGAIKHESYETMVVNPDFIIKPTNGFGDKNLLRQTLAIEKPDAVLIFNDPRFFIWLWEMEDEIHQICPILYNHLWDNYPKPAFNRVLYEATDLINCINWPTYDMLKDQFPDKVNYVPHAIPNGIYFPIPKDNVTMFKQNLLGSSRMDHFLALYVGRNARRKNPADIICSFKMFVDELEKKHGHRKATLIMHTDPLDQEGPNLHHVIEEFNVRDNVVFSKDRIGFPEMNGLYNIVDVLINASIAEGFGLPLLEAKLCEKPIIATKTGGMTRQVVDHETGFEFGVAMEPDLKTIVGNQMTPYIYEDFVTHETIKNSLMKMYEMGPEKRAEVGKKAREHAIKNYDIDALIRTWDTTITQTLEKWNSSPRWSSTTL